MSAFASPDTTGDPFSYLMWELQSVLQISLPIVFVWGLLSARLARGAVGDLVMELERPLLPGELRALLARTLGDPSLVVLYALEGQGRWVDADGKPGSLPGHDQGHQARAVTVVERDARPLAALIHDPALDQGLVRAVAAAAGMRIENERLQADVRAQLEEVRASRQRIVEAGDRERRRVERNLHDGAQQRLAALALSLAMLRDRAGADPSMVASLEQTTAELKQAIGELRELARGIHPAILTEEGLPAADRGHRLLRGIRVIGEHHEICPRLPRQGQAVAAEWNAAGGGGRRRCRRSGREPGYRAERARGPGLGGPRHFFRRNPSRRGNPGPGRDPLRCLNRRPDRPRPALGPRRSASCWLTTRCCSGRA
jgi:hypothetical protein